MRNEVESAEGWVSPLLTIATVAYLAAATVFAIAGRGDLFAPVLTYKPSFSWLLSSANEVRVDALVSAGLTPVAWVYRRLEAFSAMLVIAAALIGFVGGFAQPRRQEADPVVLMAMTVLSILLYAFFSNGTAFMEWLWLSEALPVRLSAIPAVWLVSMASATILIAWTAALLLHDLVVLALTARTRRHDPLYF